MSFAPNDVSVLRPPPVQDDDDDRCDAPDLASVPVPRWPGPGEGGGGPFSPAQAARIRRRVLEHVVLHAEPTYRFLGMLEAMSGGVLRQRDLVHVEKGTLKKAAAEAPPAAAPVPQPGGGGGGGVGAGDIAASLTAVLNLVRENNANVDQLYDTVLERLVEVEQRLATVSRDTIAPLQAALDTVTQLLGEKQTEIATLTQTLNQRTTDYEDTLETLQGQCTELQTERDALKQQLRERAVPKSSRPPAFETGDENTEDESTNALIGDAFGRRDRQLRDQVTVHLLLTPFALGLLEVARDEVAEMVDPDVWPVRLCALMHSFEGGVASHFAKYCIQVWQRQGRPPPFATGDVVVQPRKTRYNYAAEAALFEGAREYFGRLERTGDGLLRPRFHGRALDPLHLPDGVYLRHPSLAAETNLPAYRRFRLERARRVQQRLLGGEAGRPSPGGSVARRKYARARERQAAAFAPVRYAPPTYW